MDCTQSGCLVENQTFLNKKRMHDIHWNVKLDDSAHHLTNRQQLLVLQQYQRVVRQGQTIRGAHEVRRDRLTPLPVLISFQGSMVDLCVHSILLCHQDTLYCIDPRTYQWSPAFRHNAGSNDLFHHLYGCGRLLKHNSEPDCC